MAGDALKAVCILVVALFVVFIVLPPVGFYPPNMAFTCPLSWKEFVSLHKAGGYKAVEKYKMYWVDWEIPNVKPVHPSRVFYRVDLDGWQLDLHTKVPDLPPAEAYRVHGWIGFLLDGHPISGIGPSIDLGKCTIEPIKP